MYPGGSPVYKKNPKGNFTCHAYEGALKSSKVGIVTLNSQLYNPNLKRYISLFSDYPRKYKHPL